MRDKRLVAYNFLSFFQGQVTRQLRSDGERAQGCWVLLQSCPPDDCLSSHPHPVGHKLVGHGDVGQSGEMDCNIQASMLMPMTANLVSYDEHIMHALID